MKLANKLLDARSPVGGAAGELRRAGEALGLLGQAPKEFLHARRARLAAARGIDPGTVDARLVERDAARKTKDFARADAIRAELRALGVEVMDSTRGADWRLND
jgi:cysteinyl-tRNA synthetase